MTTLDSYAPTKVEFEVRQLLVRELPSAMILDEDIVTTSKKVLVFFKEGTALTPTWIERLGNFARAQPHLKLAEDVRQKRRIVGGSLCCVG